MRSRHSIRYAVALLLFLFSLGLLAWSFWPLHRTQQIIPLPTLQFLTATPVGVILFRRMDRRRLRLALILCAVVALAVVGLACGGAGMATPASETPRDGETSGTQAPGTTPPQQEPRLISLEWPERVRVGESDVVRLALEVDAEGRITPTAEVDGHQVTGQTVMVPTMDDLYQVVAEARLDLAGMEVSPRNEVSEPLMRGKTVTFYWSIIPAQAGTYRGTLWLYLNLIPKDGGPVERETLLARRLDIDGVTLMGLSGGAARTAGLAGSAVSFFLGLPFIEKILEWIWRRKRYKSGKIS